MIAIKLLMRLRDHQTILNKFVSYIEKKQVTKKMRKRIFKEVALVVIDLCSLLIPTSASLPAQPR